MWKFVILALVMLTSIPAFAGKDEAIANLQAGKIPEAIAEFTRLADGGDTLAMVTLGNIYYDGKGIAQDYAKAYDWWLRAVPGNGDAFADIGVLYRDGDGVPANHKIAYDIFLITYMRGASDMQTQYRNAGNLRKTIALMSKEDIESALCYSEAYVDAYIKNKGEPPRSTAASQAREIPLKDMGWWREGELPVFQCKQ